MAWEQFLSRYPIANKKMITISKESTWKFFVAIYICYKNDGKVKYSKVREITYVDDEIRRQIKTFDEIYYDKEKGELIFNNSFKNICMTFYNLYNYYLRKYHHTTLEQEFTFDGEEENKPKQIIVNIKDTIINSLKILNENTMMSEHDEMLIELQKYNRQISNGQELTRLAHDRVIGLSEIISLRAKIIAEEKEKFKEERVKKMQVI